MSGIPHATVSAAIPAATTAVGHKSGTPTLRKYATTTPYTTMHEERFQRLEVMASEITGNIVGPIPIESFLDYLPRPSNENLPGIKDSVKKFKKVDKARNELHMYPTLMEALTPLCPELEFVDVHNHPAADFDGKEVKPDIGVYSTHCGRSGIMDIKKTEMLFEVKYSREDDPFEDNRSRVFFHRETDAAIHTLGQITTYATAHQAAQFRSHAFSALLFRTYARLLRWDRSGVTVTGRIPYSSSKFSEFLWRYNCTTALQRGWDTSVDTNPCLPEDYRLDICVKLGLRPNTQLARMSLGPGKGNYIIGNPTYIGTASPTGRSTRTFKAWCEATNTPVFLKDTWRIYSPSYTPEHETYAKLEQANVPNIATCMEAGDILDHITRTPENVEKDWVKSQPNAIRTFRHYRLVLREIGRDLLSFDSTKELATAMRDAVAAHRHAFYDAKILHRDISAGNILITSSGRGLLIDWDLSKSTDAEASVPALAERTGTWHFMAARLLHASQDGTIPKQDRVDDLESFFHVIAWVALRATAHSLPLDELPDFLFRTFDHWYIDNEGVSRGGRGKENVLLNSFSQVSFGNEPLSHLMDTMARSLAVRYAKPITRQDMDEYNAYMALPDDELRNASLKHHSVTLRQAKLANLEREDWLQGVFDESLLLEGWDVNGRPVPHEILKYSLPSARKRKRQGENEMFPTQKKKFALEEGGAT
ncbi:hypothetical protein BU17DRAFT_94560 [Hysterangium stoloniferum]|nr:hypothetical protein BU17DRAFT_94560 [Hysterangium stoloniferum]